MTSTTKCTDKYRPVRRAFLKEAYPSTRTAALAAPAIRHKQCMRASRDGFDIFGGANFSPCRSYRYTLARTWQATGPTALFICLNPSTADEATDDATVRRCIGFAKRLGFGRLLLTNLFGFRATCPIALTKATDPVGPENDDWIREASMAADLTIVAWGIHGRLHERDQAVLRNLSTPHCLGTTKDGQPRHPLYLSANASLKKYRG